MPRPPLALLVVLAALRATAADASPVPVPADAAPAAAETSAAAAPADDAPVPPRAVNRRCPVTGDPIDRNVPVQVVPLTRDGRETRVAVGLCCEDCVNDLRREPQRFAAAALEDRKAPKPAK